MLGRIFWTMSALIALTGSAATANCTWQVFTVPNPSAAFNALTALGVIDDSDVWAAGIDGNGTYGSLQFVHFDGSSWTQVPPPKITANNPGIEQIVALSSSDVWGVGENDDGSHGVRPIIVHWDGVRWRIVSHPAQNLNGDLSGLARVGSQLWAAGDFNVSGQLHPLIEHFTGKKWLLDKVYQPPDQSIFQTIAGNSVNSLWAGGYGGSSGGFIERYDPTKHAWAQWPNNVGAYISTMSAMSDSDVWAGGPPGFGLFVERWNGKSWKQVQYPRGGSAILVQISVDSSTGYTWFGGYLNNSGQRTAYVDRYRGGHWKATPFVQVGSYGTVPASVSPVLNGSNVWAVGYYQPNSGFPIYNLAERWTCPAGAE